MNSHYKNKVKEYFLKHCDKVKWEKCEKKERGRRKRRLKGTNSVHFTLVF